MAFEIVSFLEVSTQQQCRDLGNLLLEYADVPRGEKMQEQIALIRSMLPPSKDQDLASRLELARQRVYRQSHALRADGMDYRALVVAELSRRGDARSFEQYRQDVGGPYENLGKTYDGLA